MKSVVLLSSGLDSTVNLFQAKKESEVLLALTFDYGQRAAAREIERSAKIAKLAGVKHHVVALPWFRDFTKTSLVDASMEVPTTAVSIDSLEVSRETAKAVWVPNRNGIFLNIGAAFAESLKADWLVPGFNFEEAQTFPDNSESYLRSMTEALKFSTSTEVKVKCFTTALTKKKIVELGRKLGAPMDLMWPCYFGGESPCGQCESCRRFRNAL